MGREVSAQESRTPNRGSQQQKKGHFSGDFSSTHSFAHSGNRSLDPLLLGAHFAQVHSLTGFLLLLADLFQLPPPSRFSPSKRCLLVIN